MEHYFYGSLHNHTEYSNARLRDSTNDLSEIMWYSAKLGHQVFGLTDHECICAHVKAEKIYNKIKKEFPDFKLIRGNEIYLCRDGLNATTYVRGEDKYYHFCLYAKDQIGHQQIRELSTRAWMRSYSQGKMTRVPTYYQDIIDIIGSNPGHVIGSTACLGGFLGTYVLQNQGKISEFTADQRLSGWLTSMVKLFGKDHFYLELQPSNNQEQIIVNSEIINLANYFHVPYILTLDAHYLNKVDAPIHAAFLRAQEGEREVESFYATTYMMETNEIESFLGYLTTEEIQYAYENILKIKNMCSDYSLLKPLKIPTLNWRTPKCKTEDVIKLYNDIPQLKTFIESDYIGDQRLAYLLVDKILSDPRLQNQKIYNETNSNLDIVWKSSLANKAHWSAYFLNLQYTLDKCWEAGTLVGPGRGSGVGFLLLYLLDIIQINSMWETTRTFSWRFLNPERVSVLDIDTDIEGGRRALVLQALRNEYGQDRVSNVVTFGTEGSKSAVQTAARGLGYDVDLSIYISSLIPADRGKTRTLKQCYYGDAENDFKPIPLFVHEMNNYPDLWETAQRIEGLVCRLGEHAGGVIFVDEPFTNSTALMKVPNGDVVTQFDLHDCEEVSLIKVDLLSVEALDKMHACLDLLIDQGYIKQKNSLRETYEEYLNIYNIERSAPAMWDMVHKHEIQALFQMEQQSGIQGIALTKPSSVDDLAVLNSIIRLMPQSKDDEQPLVKYARFKNNISEWYREMTNYGLTQTEQDLLTTIVGQSYGIAESQEKIMQLVQLPEIGGFSLSWADSLRKAVAKFLASKKEIFQIIIGQNR